jgi:hypothetical protein
MIRIPSDAMLNRATRLPVRRDRYLRRVVRALGWRRLAVVVLMTFLWSTRRLVSADMMDFFSPAELALLGLELYAEMAVIAATLMLGYTLLDEALADDAPLRLVALCGMLLTLSVALTALLYAYYGHTFNDLPPPVRLFADSLRWGLPAIVLAVVADVHERAIRTQAAAHAEEQSRLRLAATRPSSSSRCCRRRSSRTSCSTCSAAFGASTARSRRPARTRSPACCATCARRCRSCVSQQANLGHEIELVGPTSTCSRSAWARASASRSRPTARFTRCSSADAARDLVENAIKHGIEPSGSGGHVTVRARRRATRLEVAVLDDGVGFGGAATDGTGVGLVNVRRQLKARYGSAARLTLEPRSRAAPARPSSSRGPPADRCSRGPAVPALPEGACA